MKEASGELNMTVVTIVAIAAVGALFYIFVWPMIQTSIATQTCKVYGANWHAVRQTKSEQVGNATANKWLCCPEGKSSIAEGCVDGDASDTATPKNTTTPKN